MRDGEFNGNYMEPQKFHGMQQQDVAIYVAKASFDDVTCETYWYLYKFNKPLSHSPSSESAQQPVSVTDYVVIFSAEFVD